MDVSTLLSSINSLNSRLSSALSNKLDISGGTLSRVFVRYSNGATNAALRWADLLGLYNTNIATVSKYWKSGYNRVSRILYINYNSDDTSNLIANNIYLTGRGYAHNVLASSYNCNPIPGSITSNYLWSNSTRAFTSTLEPTGYHPYYTIPYNIYELTTGTYVTGVSLVTTSSSQSDSWNSSGEVLSVQHTISIDSSTKKLVMTRHTILVA